MMSVSALSPPRGVGRHSSSSSSAAVVVILMGLVLCTLVGLAIPVFPAWVVLGLVLGPVAIVGGALWPLPALLLALALIFQMIPGRFVPGVGSFHVSELLILYLFATVFMRSLWQRESLLKPMGPFTWPLLYLLLCVVVSAAYVKFFAPNQYLLTELRGFVTWLLIPLLCFVIRDKRQRSWLVASVIAIAACVSLMAIAQSMWGVHILDNRVEALDVTNADITRSVTGGAVYLTAFSLFWVANNVSDRARMAPLLLVLALVFAGGLAVTFGRGVWLATAFGFLVSAWFSRGWRGVLLSGIVGSLALAVVLAAFAVVKPRFVEALVERATGVTQEIRSGGSFGFRFTEAAYAFDAIAKRPLTGVGIGGDYKRNFKVLPGFDVEARYIHNAYIGFMVKMGVQAILFPIAVCLLFFGVAYRNRISIEPKDRATFGAMVGAFCVPLITSFTQPEWIERSGVAAYCVFVVLLIKFSPLAFGPKAASGR